ncbi:MAG TPA: biotin/lipoyl-containing protein [Pyrinomonadaceae bacterium]|jgi:biotin carboxyl carrier protein
MKLTANIAGESYELNVQRDGMRLNAAIDERVYELEAREMGAGIYLLIVDERVYECRVDRGGAARAPFSVQVSGQVYAVSLADPKRLSATEATGTSAAEGSVEIIAPMPGKLVRVLVAAGAQVEAGDGLVVVEAMKMQNELKSPKAGTVTKIHAEVGATVNAGDVLIVVE